MNRAEFDKACTEICIDYWPGSVTDEMFDDINFVYTWYPTISETKGKQQIALLYTSFGFAIIQDMMDRAQEAYRIDRLIHEAKQQLAEATEKKHQLSSGHCNKSRTSSCWRYVTDVMPAE